MPTNFYMFFIVALIPLIVGAVYYHPKVAGNAWMKTNGFTEESLQGANMMLIFGLTYLFSFMISFFLPGLVIHQASIFSLLVPEVLESGSAVQQSFNTFMGEFVDRHRTFGHGALHGGIATIFFVLPLIAINALFERRGWKYVLIHFGYWFISLILMGAVLCQMLTYPTLS
ncbi:MAG: DUF1761 domain-containing protein [Chitinophagales bacterium]